MTKILAVTSITSRFQTTIPQDVRELLKITEKDKVLWIYENDKIVVKKA